MKSKLAYYIGVIIIVVVGIKWIADSNDYGELLVFSKDKKPIELKKTDDLFGTEITIIEWKEGFWFGLLPNVDTISFNMVIAAIPLTSIIIFIMILNFIYFYRKKKTIKNT